MIDDTSLKILKILQEKARIPNIEVARRVGLAPSAVLERIRKLEKQGIIDGYEVRLNPQRFRRSLIAFITVKTDRSRDSERVGKHLAAIPEVQEVHFVSGTDGYLVKMRVADSEELGRLIQTKIAAIKAVRSTRTAIVIATVKETARIPIDRMDQTNARGETDAQD
jgi:Lrp/AsnC family leucine-responsive transcriptional regulator